MSEQEKTVAKRLADAFDALPAPKKEYLLGFADGVVATKPPAPTQDDTPAN